MEAWIDLYKDPAKNYQQFLYIDFYVSEKFALFSQIFSVKV